MNVERCYYPGTVETLRELRKGRNGAEMLKCLRNWAIAARDPWEPQGFECDAMEAVYWFCIWNYDGARDPRYAAQCVNPYSPGPICDGPEDETTASDILCDLESLEES